MSGITQNWQCWCSSFVVCGVLIVSWQEYVFAQITPDNTLPNNSIVTPDGSTFNITGGTQAGNNLFHSFSEFSVHFGSTASFNNAVDIQNIISRVTGGSVSKIDGVIHGHGTANLFLINPNGIIFGRDARLDIGGSFVGTTANAIGFGDRGFFSASNPETSPSLLTVNPSALLFNQIQTASIQNNSVGLRVPDGNSLLLVGGDINMDGGRLYALGGKVELGGLASAGTVGLNGDGNNLSLSFPNSVERSNVFLDNSAGIYVAAGDGGSIMINVRNLEMTGESFLNAGIDREPISDNSKAGNIEVNATGVINLSNESNIYNLVLSKANAQGGNVEISTSALQLEGRTQVGAGTFGEGKGGDLTIHANTLLLKDGAQVSARTFGEGKGGDLTIHANTLLLKDGAQVDASTFGEGKGGNLTVHAQDVQLIDTAANSRQVPSALGTSAEVNSTGDAGNLTIHANTLLVKDGSVVSTSTFGEGKGGNLTVHAQDVQLIGTSADGQSPSGLNASTQTNSTGNAGNLTIHTNTLLVRDGAQVNASTFGEGKGGNVTVHAQDVQLIGTSADGEFLSGLFARQESTSTGDAGDLTIYANTLLVKDGSVVSTTTFGAGKGGNVTLHAQDVQLIGTSVDGQSPSGLNASTQTNSTGNAGNLTIHTNTLLVRDGAQVNASTFGEGKGGNVTVHAQDVQLIGTSADGEFLSGLFARQESTSTGDAGDLTIYANTLLIKDEAQVSASTFGEGKGGNLSIKTNTLLVQNGAQVNTATFGAGKGGNLTVDAQNVQLIGESADGQFPSGLVSSAQRYSTGDAGNLSIKTSTLLVNGALVNTTTSGAGKGGNLTVDAQNVQVIGRSANGQFASALNTSAQADSTGDAGDLTIETNTLLVKDGAAISVQSAGTGTAGNMTVNARYIRLNNDALLNASTRSTKVNPNRQQATININSENLIMSRNSNIFTNATGENVTGGNINIDTDFLIGFENSDISANSVNFRGGNVRINAQGIFGIQFRDVASDNTSDITATGASSDLSGSVELITPDIDPNSGLVELPTISVDTEVAQGCYSPNYAQSKFAIAGRGGLPANPKDILTPDATQIDWVSLKPSNNDRSITTKPTTSTPERIFEATNAVLNAKGQIVLTANSSTANPPTPRQNPIQCHGS
ncbi:filamentous hemagglutinin N-terminal domain-containing protein [Nostoc sp. CCY 9925]|uniref:two-partner secretion domain-containing protein n=1 Tax=Nostoc sp. CCY 9925 TaxID=3103865 RepID=UPI0039C6536B